VACKWTKEERKDRDVKLTGEVMSNTGKTVPVFLRLVQERGAWRVFSLRTPGPSKNEEDDRFSLMGKGGSFNSAANHEMPSPKIIHGLIKESLMLFSNSIQRHNFNEFYSKVSLTWQNQLTTGQLERAFKPFLDANVDLRNIQELQPVLDPKPEINSDGVLIIVGTYDTKPYRMAFTLRYIYEFPLWKLYGFEVQVRK